MSASDPTPGGPLPGASPAGAMPVTLRVLIEGAGRQSKADTIEYLATANSTAGDTVRDGRGRALSQWLTFSAGWYEGSPLRFEVVATAPGIELAIRAALVERADAVILVVDCSEQGWAASASRQLISLGLEAGGRDAERGLVVFAYRPAADGEVTTGQILEELALPPDTSIVTTSPEGAGVRYGFALAVRLGLHRIRVLDNRGEPRCPPTSLAEFRRSLLDGVGDNGATDEVDVTELPMPAVALTPVGLSADTAPEVAQQPLTPAAWREPVQGQGSPEEPAVDRVGVGAARAAGNGVEEPAGAGESEPEVAHQPVTAEPLAPPAYPAAGSAGHDEASPVGSAHLEPLHDGLGRIERSDEGAALAPGLSGAAAVDVEDVERFEGNEVEPATARPPEREWFARPGASVGPPSLSPPLRSSSEPEPEPGPDGETSHEELISRHLPDVFAELWPAADELQLSSLVVDAPRPHLPTPAFIPPGPSGPVMPQSSSPVVVPAVVGRPMENADPAVVGRDERVGGRPHGPSKELIRWGGLVATLGVCACVLIIVLLAAA